MYDIIIVGCGLVGLINALLLAKESGLRIAILDAKTPGATWNVDHYDSRVFAITPATKNILQNLGVWSLIESRRLSVYTRMQIWDEKSGAELIFDQADLSVPCLGYIVEENLIRTALLDQAAEVDQLDLLYPVQLRGLSQEPNYVELDCMGEAITAPLRGRLLIGADGAQSWIREQAGIVLHIQAYHHSALIAQVQTEKVHQRTAGQVFLGSDHYPSGPLAFLPLNDPHQCSIVWSTVPQEAERLLNMAEAEFQDLLGKAFADRLGKIQLVCKRQIFPLYERHVENYVKARVALIGDAAHTLHPLAGQGINLGIADAASLAAVIIEALNKKRDYANLSTLRRYERARKSENLIMLNTVKLLKNLFTGEHKGLQILRSQVLQWVNQSGLLKKFLASYAMGY